jgi:hypothetical protein
MSMCCPPVPLERGSQPFGSALSHLRNGLSFLIISRMSEHLTVALSAALRYPQVPLERDSHYFPLERGSHFFGSA